MLPNKNENDKITFKNIDSMGSSSKQRKSKGFHGEITLKYWKSYRPIQMIFLFDEQPQHQQSILCG